MNKKVTDVLKRKTRSLIAVTPNSTVFDALHIMSDNNIGAVLVVANGQYKGIMTERDYARKVILKKKASADTQVDEIMSDDIPVVTTSDSVDHCMQLMAEKNVRYLPVIDNNHLVGIISIHDLIRETIQSQAETINHLTDYLHAGIF